MFCVKFLKYFVPILFPEEYKALIFTSILLSVSGNNYHKKTINNNY